MSDFSQLFVPCEPSAISAGRRIDLLTLHRPDTWGHFVQFYESDAFLVETIAYLTAKTLNVGNSSVLVSSASHLRTIEQQLASYGFELRRLAAEGRYVALEAETVHDAMTIAKERRIDLVLTDLMMPGGGHYFIEWLKKAKPETRVLYMSGYSPVLMDLPGAAIVQKPFSKDCLLEQVEFLLRAT